MTPSTAPLRNRALPWLWGAAALALLLGAVRGLYLPAMGRLSEQRATARDLQVKLSDAQAWLADQSARTAALERARAAYDHELDRVRSGPSLASVLEELSLRAKRQRLELLAVEPLPPEASATLRAVAVGPGVELQPVPLRLSLRGRYQQVGEFLGNLASAPFLSAVYKLALEQGQPGSTQLGVELWLLVFVRKGPGA